MRKVTFIFIGVCVAICVAIPLLWLGVMFAVSRADPASARAITVQLSGASGVQPNSSILSISSFVDSELLRHGFSRDQQTHDPDGTSWVTVYSYQGNRYPPKTDVLSSGCGVHEGSQEVRIELWELGVSRPTHQFDKIRHELEDALVRKCGNGHVH